MEKYELLDQTIDRILGTYSGLRRAFVKGHPRHPFVSSVGERWVPLHTILSEPWSSGEAKIAAVLLDVFHDEYGADQIIGCKFEDTVVDGEYVRPSVWLWPSVRVVTKEFPHLDTEAYRVLGNLIGR